MQGAEYFQHLSGLTVPGPRANSDASGQRPRGPAVGDSAAASTVLQWGAALGMLLLASLVDAGQCGDDIAGKRVACACGDTVVSDTVLRRADPVVATRCYGGGLVVQADGMAETITLDLDGLTLIGTGAGDGIEVRAGGSEGAVLRGGSTKRAGQVVGFGTGIHVSRAGAARRIESLTVSGNRHDGILLRNAGTILLGIRAHRNGRDGIRATGQGGRFLGVETTENAGSGIQLSSRYTVVEATSERNRRHGISVRGSRNDLRRSVANDNKGYGILISGPKQETAGVMVERNGAGGISHGIKSGKSRP
jgi:hypothetical protein